MLKPLILLNAAGQRPSPFLTPSSPMLHQPCADVEPVDMEGQLYHINSSIRDLSVCGFWYLLGFWNQSLAHTEG